MQISCPARVTIGRRVDEDNSVGPWRVIGYVPHHNHRQADHAFQTKHSALAQDVKEYLFELRTDGIPVFVLRDLMQKTTAQTITEDQIYSALAEQARIYEDGRGDLRTLRDQINQEGYRSKVYSAVSVSLSIFVVCVCVFYISVCRVSQILIDDIPSVGNVMNALVWCTDSHVTKFKRYPHVIILDETRMFL